MGTPGAGSDVGIACLLFRIVALAGRMRVTRVETRPEAPPETALALWLLDCLVMAFFCFAVARLAMAVARLALGAA